MSLLGGLLLATAAPTRQHRGWIKKNKTTWVKCKVHLDNTMKWDFLGPPSLHPQCSSGAVLRPLRQAQLQYKAQLAANLDLAISHLQARDSKPNTRAPSYFPTQKQFKTDLTPM